MSGTTDPVFIAAVAALLAAHAILYVFPRFTYELTADHLRIRRYVLCRIPLGKWSVRLRQVRDARQTWIWIPPAARILGRVYSAGGVVLVLDTRGLLGRRKVFVTPDSPAQFVEEVRRAAGLPSGESESRAGKPDRALAAGVGPRWLTDALLACSGVLVLYVLSKGSYLHTTYILVHLFGQLPSGHALAIGAMIVISAVPVWMVADSGMALFRTHKTRYIVWMIAVFLLFPAAWLYYVLEWRPRAASRDDSIVSSP